MNGRPEPPPAGTGLRVETVAYLGAWALFVLGLAFGVTLEAIVPLERFQRFPAGVNIYLFLTQDLVWLGLGALLLPAAWAVGRRGRWLEIPPGRFLHRWWLWGTILGFAITATVGVDLVYERYALSLDEFLARFQAEALLSGHLFAPLREGWADYARALQPIFMRHDLEAGVWGPGYRHGNALVLAMFDAFGLVPWAHVVTATLALVMMGRLCRRLWPDRPRTVVAGVFLLASSAQVWVTAMTSYAMTPHLLLSLVWVELYLRDDFRGHLGALAIAPLAIGLHQFHIHPLIALPFLAWLVVDRRWRLAAVYGVWYALWIVLWIMWRDLLGHGGGADAAPETTFVLARITRLWMAGRTQAGLVFGAVNFFRFMAWQNLALVPLMLAGALSFRSASRAVRTAAWSTVLLLLPHVLLMPTQGHGWGYRYLHPALGFLVLIGIHGAVEISGRTATDRSRVFLRSVVALAAVSLAALPLRGVQVRRFVAPYAAGSARIERSDAEVVVVDDRRIWFGIDLVRNDPLLEYPPHVMAASVLTPARTGALCAERTVEVIGASDLEPLGIPPMPAPGSPELPPRFPGCGESQ